MIWTACSPSSATRTRIGIDSPPRAWRTISTSPGLSSTRSTEMGLAGSVMEMPSIAARSLYSGEHGTMSVEHRSHGCNHRDPTFPDFGFTCYEVPARLSIVDLPQLAEDRGSSFMPHRQHSREVLA